MPGEYKGLPGRHNCTRCESGKYSAALGATECHACRKNSMTPLGSQNAEDCACKPGFELLNTTVPPSDAIVWVLEDAGDGLTGGSSPGKSCDEICAAEDMQCDGPTLAGPIRARDLAEILVRAQWSESYGFTPTCTPTTPYFARQSGLALFGHWAPEPGAESSCPDSVTPTCSATHNSSGEIQRLCPCYRPATTLTCEPCALGYFKNVSGNHRCQQCPRGSFSNETGSTHCTECPDKNMHTMQRASRNISQCMCNAGYTGPNGKACTACEPGQYKELPGPHGCFLCGRNTYSPDPAATNESECLDCPALSVSAEGSNTEGDCLCIPGFEGGDFDDGWRNCSACRAGTFKSVNGTSECVECAAGTYGVDINATSPDACLLCDLGTYTGVTGRTACDECAEGTYNDQLGVSACTTCPPDVVWVLADLDTVHGSCDDVCGRENRRCDASSFDLTYSSSGLYSVLTETLGYDHVRCCSFAGDPFLPAFDLKNPTSALWKYNYARTSSCSATPPTDTWRRLCPCTGVLDANATSPPAPTFDDYAQDEIPVLGWPTATRKTRTTSPVGSTSKDQCICAPGFSGPTHQSCAPCQPGEFKSVSGASRCLLCPENTYSSFSALSLEAECTPCDVNRVSPEGSSRKEQCVCDSGSELIGDQCFLCQPGSYKDRVQQAGFVLDGLVQDTCDPCPQGTFAPDAGSRSDSDCLRCEPGKYRDSIRSSACKDCPAGQFQPIAGSTACLECPTNSSSLPGAQDWFDCKCAPGFAGEYGLPRKHVHGVSPGNFQGRRWQRRL